MGYKNLQPDVTQLLLRTGGVTGDLVQITKDPDLALVLEIDWSERLKHQRLVSVAYTTSLTVASSYNTDTVSIPILTGGSAGTDYTISCVATVEHLVTGASSTLSAIVITVKCAEVSSLSSSDYYTVEDAVYQES